MGIIIPRRISKFRENANFDERISHRKSYYANRREWCSDDTETLRIQRPGPFEGPLDSETWKLRCRILFGELFSESSVSKFYLSLTNCTIFASNNFGSQIISIELLCVYRAKYPPSPQTCSNVTWIRNVTLLRLLEKRASFSTLPCSIARHLYRSLGFIALNCRVTCDWRMESRGPRSIFFTVLKRSWRWYLQRGRDIGSTISKGDCEPLRKPRVI